MLEVLFLIFCGKKLARMAREKGRSGGWAGLGIGLWIFGELVGFVIGMALGMEMGAYLIALMLAGLGIGVGFIVVSSLSDLSQVEALPAALPAAQGPLAGAPLEVNEAHDPDNPYSPSFR